MREFCRVCCFILHLSLRRIFSLLSIYYLHFSLKWNCYVFIHIRCFPLSLCVSSMLGHIVSRFVFISFTLWVGDFQQTNAKSYLPKLKQNHAISTKTENMKMLKPLTVFTHNLLLNTHRTSRGKRRTEQTNSNNNKQKCHVQQIIFRRK